MSQRTITICDICNEEIKTTTDPSIFSTPYIDAGVYGMQFHINCFNAQTPFKILKYLGLDDIKHVDSRGETEKLIYMRSWIEAPGVS